MKEAKAYTRLTEKHASPLVIRKITRYGFPIFVGIITDDNLDRLDEVVHQVLEKNKTVWKSDSIQAKRDLSAILSEAICEAFPHTEGVAVTFAVDKCMVSSLFGDFMNHAQCKFEYYTLLSISTNV